MPKIKNQPKSDGSVHVWWWVRAGRCAKQESPSDRSVATLLQMQACFGQFLSLLELRLCFVARLSDRDRACVLLCVNKRLNQARLDCLLVRPLPPSPLAEPLQSANTPLPCPDCCLRCRYFVLLVPTYIYTCPAAQNNCRCPQ